MAGHEPDNRVHQAVYQPICSCDAASLSGNKMLLQNNSICFGLGRLLLQATYGLDCFVMPTLQL